ncbi:hypothetical protein MNAN1_001480 [Malassezia nana]|uniref:Signal peptidase complex subunit 2 n=1 Tax=Malassezia nana TaxID=180528 RepID=A0AAF0J1Z8_9BASI|nr:hypothetical protein MNAN1_001480 [Malassezia nana]
MVEDVLMFVNMTVSVLMIGSVLLVYRQKLEWKEAKPIFMVTVPMYRIRGPLVFIGSRPASGSQNETENLQISSPYFNQADLTGKKAPDGRPILKPPSYELLVQYTRTTQGRVLAKREGRIPIGHFGEWFTEEGEFMESIFRQRLVQGLQKLLGM